MISIRPGEQKIISTDVTDALSAVNINLCSNIVAYLIQTGGVIVKFSKTTMAGYLPLVIDSVLNNRFNLLILKTDTLKLQAGFNCHLDFKLIYADGTGLEGVTDEMSVKPSLLSNE